MAVVLLADRTTKVTLTAQVSGYLAGMDAAQRKTAEFAAGSSQKLAQQKAAFQQVGVAALAVGAIAAAGVVLAVKAFAEFDAKMAQVKTLSHATADEMTSLANSALHMGQAIGFSATQVADAEIELVKAGVSVKDIMGGALKGALELAAAGQIDVAQATEIATIALTQFSLKGKDVPHVADLLAAGADKALGGVGDLGEALKSGGLVAAQFGVSLDETVGTLSAFANAGLLGETAGTDLRQMLLKLANPAKQSSDELKKLGINIYGTSGQFVGVAGLAGQLKDKLSSLTPEARNSALAIIFGSRAIAGANVLYKEGAAGISGWTNSVNDTGFAAKQAAGKMDNLKGDLSKLGAAFQTNVIEAGGGANNILRDLVQGLTGVTAAVGSLPAPVLAAGLGLVGIVAVIGLTSGAVLTAIPKIVALKDAMGELGLSAGGVIGKIGGISAGLAVAGLIISKIASDEAAATASTQAFQASLDAATGAVTSYTRELVAKKLQEKGAFDDAKKYGITQAELTDAVLKGGVALDVVRGKIASYSAATIDSHDRGVAMADGQNHLATSVAQTTTELVGGEAAQRNLIAANADSAGSTVKAADAYKLAADQAATLESNLTSLIDTINKANGVGQDAVSANANYQKALVDVNAAIKNIDPVTGKAKAATDALKHTLDESTAAGSANAQMLSDLAAKGEDAAAKQFALDGNTQTYTASLAANRKAIYDAAVQMGATADKAQALADKVAAIPTEKEIKILADTTAANKEIDAFILGVNGKIAKVPVGTVIRPGQVGVNADGGMYNYQKFADGGVATGIYAGRPGGIHKFAELETGWEAYISGKPGQNARNRSIWADAGARLGVPAPSSGGFSVTVVNKSGVAISDLIDMRIDSAAGQRKVDLSTGMQRVAY
jgi:TP901 family phage tail tape measure protein